jgi:predicted O-methyltransferase YrrM
VTRDISESPMRDDAVADVSEILARIEIPPAYRYVSVRSAEGQFMHRWIRDHGLTRTLEVGLAYGASASCIMSAHDGTHTCIDPFQDHWENLGLRNLKNLGYAERLDFHAGFSHDVLPELRAAKRSFDFAFIDGNHLYDAIFVDFYHVDLLLENQGYVLFHDAWMRGTQLVASFIRRNRRDYRRIRCPVRNLILFQKVGQDQRDLRHFKEFYTWRGLFSHKIICWLLRRGILQRILAGRAKPTKPKT